MSFDTDVADVALSVENPLGEVSSGAMRQGMVTPGSA